MNALCTFLSALAVINATAQVTHLVEVRDGSFDPPYLSIQLGDHVRIQWDNDATDSHTFTQVERATWEVNGLAPLSGGVNFGEDTPDEGTDFTFTPTGDVWYVCQFNAGMGMKGMINVESGVGLEETAGPHAVRFAPNPASVRTTIIVPDRWPINVVILDRTGAQVSKQNLFAGRVLDLSNLAPGLYLAEVWYTDGPLLGRKRLLVEN